MISQDPLYFLEQILGLILKRIKELLKKLKFRCLRWNIKMIKNLVVGIQNV